MEQFTWKSDGKIFDGVGIYHLTFHAVGDLCFGVLRGRSKQEIADVVRPMQALRQPCDISNPAYVQAVRSLAWVELTELGKAIERDIARFDKHHPGVKVCQKVVMDTHLHLVVWVQEDQGKSIRQMAQALRGGLTQIARQMGAWPPASAPAAEAWLSAPAADAGPSVPAADAGPCAPAADAGPCAPAADSGPSVPAAEAGTDAARPCNTNACAEGAGVDMEETRRVSRPPFTPSPPAAPPPSPPSPSPPSQSPSAPHYIVEKPFIRTLARRGQLRAMIDYVILNPYRKWIKQQRPELFRIHRMTCIQGLTFRSLGNHWLLDWPMRQMVECSRTATPQEWDAQLATVMQQAQAGAVTYTAAVSDGEQYIADHIREAGFPLVRLLLDGFPPPGSAEEQKYRPGGVMNDACGQGRLLLLEASAETYSDPRIVAMTDQALRRKAEARRRSYEPLPHHTRRWRFMAGNEMMRLLCDIS